MWWHGLLLRHLLVYSGKAVSVSEEEEDGEYFSTSRMEMDDEGNLIVTRPKISGKIKLTYNADKATEQQMEVDADAYMAELRGQVGSCACLNFLLFYKVSVSVFFSKPCTAVVVELSPSTRGGLQST